MGYLLLLFYHKEEREREGRNCGIERWKEGAREMKGMEGK